MRGGARRRCYTEETGLEWRNWQTHGTQNPAPFTGHEGSTPSSSTNQFTNLGVFWGRAELRPSGPNVTVVSPSRNFSAPAMYAATLVAASWRSFSFTML